MSEDKPQAAPGQPPLQSFGEAPEQPSESFGDAPASDPDPTAPGQSFGDAPEPEPAPSSDPEPAPAPAPPATPPAAPPAAPVAATQPVGQTFGDAPVAPTQTFGDAPAAPTQTVDAPSVATPASKRGLLRVVGGIVVALLLVAIIGVFLVVRLFNSNPTSDVAVGDCLANVPTVAEGETREVTDARTVDCADPAATHKVEGRYEDKTVEESKEVCASHPTASFMITTADDSGSRGYVLCLSQITK